MRAFRVPFAIFLLLLPLIAQSIGAAPALAQSTDDLVALDRQVVQLSQAGKYTKAVRIAQRGVGLAEQLHGPEHIDVATWLNNLGLVYRALSRYADAEFAYKRSLAIRQKLLGPAHRDVGTSLHNLADLYRALADMPTPNRFSSEHWPSSRRRSVPSTAMWAPRSVAWPSFIMTRAATPTPSHFTSARSPSAKKQRGLSTQM